MIRRIVSTLSVLAATVSLTAPVALADNPSLQAWRETGITTKCEWQVDEQNPRDPMVRLTSYTPGLPGPVCHVVALVPNFGPNGAMIKSFSFDVHFNKQTHTNVRPSVCIEYDDGSGKLQYEQLEWDELERQGIDGGRTRLTYDFKAKKGNPLKVRRIAIGASERTIPAKLIPGVAVPDFNIARFVAEDASSAKMTNKYIMAIGDRDKLDRADRILEV